MYICIDSSQRFVVLHNNSSLFSSKKDSKSFKNKEKKKENTFSPCYESSDGLQKTLYCFEKYCDLWKLTVNTTTTKVVIFSKKKVRQN
jgi:hypothetical protein